MFDPKATEQIKALSKAYNDARDKRRKREQKREEVQAALSAARSRRQANPAEAFAAFEAGKPLPSTPAGESVESLTEVLAGADEALRLDREAESKARGELQAALVAALQARAETWGAAYLAAATALRSSWEALAGMQAVIGAIVKEHAGDVVETTEWAKCYVPSSEQLSTLRGRGIDTGNGFHTRVLMACEGKEYDRLALSAAGAIEQGIRALLGGDWPFDTSVGYDVGPVNVSRPAMKPIRPALEKAWDQTHRGDAP